MNCSNCNKDNPPYKAVVISNKFLKRACVNCRAETVRPHNDAEFSRARGRDDHARDIIQPFIDGKPNPDFAHAYPQQAKEMFSEEEMALM